MTEVQFRKKQGQQSQKDPEYEVKKYGFFFFAFILGAMGRH